MFLLRGEHAGTGGGAALALVEAPRFGAVTLLLPLLLLLLPLLPLLTLTHLVREPGSNVGLDGVELRQGLVPQAVAAGALELGSLLTLALRLGTALLGLGAAVVRRLAERAVRAVVVHFGELEVETDALVAIRHSLLLWQRIVVGVYTTIWSVSNFNFLY